MPKKITVTIPVHNVEEERIRALLGAQGPFIDGFHRLSELTAGVVPIPRGRTVTPSETLNAIVNVACAAVSTASHVRGMVETDEDFSPLENQLADILLTVMAAASTHKLRVAQCAAARISGKVSISYE